MSTFEEEMERPDDFFDGLIDKFTALGFPCCRAAKNRVDIVPSKVILTQKKTAPTMIMAQKEKFAHVRG